MTSDDGRRITPEDIRSKLTDIQGEATAHVEEAKSQLLTAAAVVGVVVVIVVFVFGRRSGKRSSAVIEVRRG